jgi:hypothetical protein
MLYVDVVLEKKVFVFIFLLGYNQSVECNVCLNMENLIPENRSVRGKRPCISVNRNSGTVLLDVPNNTTDIQVNDNTGDISILNTVHICN